MNTAAWCGNCGGCPRCGIVYSHEYNAVVTNSAAQVIEAHAKLEHALQRIADIAPLLHVDREALFKSLDEHLSR